ncbi:hypothetical protein [Paenibacillus sp. NEAU-GSW1]|uniref:phage tail protein n=1 Tax=Paenibacillus sp. NEAU-GSW1 TaxID=2682486 RepID=UPI0012E2870F|nr:hypothetical protein [Paenibacillus sp. NEAU-GSW1]MUT65317.1 hypothetical protein [Paenibacillus sp. NEAU-GSW1]
MAAANTAANVAKGYAVKKSSDKYALVTNGGKGFSKKGIGKQSMKGMFGKLDKSSMKVKKAGAAESKKEPSFMEKLKGNMKGIQEKVGGVGEKIAGNIKGIQEIFGGAGEALKSFGSSTVVAAADLETSKIGFDFAMSKLQGQGGGGKGKGKKGPASAQDLEKKFADYWTALRDNAQNTAFSADQVLEGGMSAVKLTKGDTGKAMQLVKLAEDMAGFNPGKSVAEAMEAIEAANSKDYKKLEAFGFEFKKGSWDKFLKDAGTWFQGGGEKLNKSANGMWEIVTEGLKGSLQNAGVAALEQVKPIMQRLVTWLTSGGFKKLENIAAKTVDVFVKCFLWMMDVIGPVFGWLEKALDWVGANFETLKPILNGLIAAFAAFAVISTVMSIISGIGAAIGLLTNPIFWIVAAIGLLTAAWTGNWFGIQDKTKAAVAWIVASYQSLAQEIEWFIADTKQFFTDLAGWMKEVWSGIAAVTTELAGRIWQGVSAAFQYVWSIVTGYMTRVFTFYKLIWDGMAAIVTGIGSFIANTVQSAFDTISGIVSAAFDTIVGIGKAGMEMLRGIFKGVWQGAAGDHKGALITIKNAIMGAVGKIGALLDGFASTAFNYARNFIIGYAGGLIGLFQTVRDAVMPVWNYITATWDEISTFVVTTGKRIQDWARTAWGEFAAYMQGVGRAISDGFMNAMTAVGQAIQTGLGYIWTGLGAIWTYVEGILSAIGTFFVTTFNQVSTAVGTALSDMYKWGADTLNAIGGVFTTAFTGINEFIALIWGIIAGTFFWGARIVYDVLNGIAQYAMTFATQFMDGLIQGFQSMYGTLMQTVQQIWDSIRNIFGSASATVNMNVQPINGSHKTGLNSVPFNGYIAELHQGEMVLTSEQASRYRNGQLSGEQRSSMLQPYGGAGGTSGPVDQSKSVAIANLIGEMHVHDEADENRFIDKLKRMLEEDLLTEGEGVYAG